MLYNNVSLTAIGYELAPVVVTSTELEERLQPVYKKLGLPTGQLEMLTGIRERRYWNPKQAMWQPAAAAARKAIAKSNIQASDVQMLIYAGVCRDNLEPATACAVADSLGLNHKAVVFDISNACLGILSGIVEIANAIELNQIQAGLVVSCESARQIVDLTIDRITANPNMDAFRPAMATLTGGSGAVAVLLARSDSYPAGHKLQGGVIRSATEHHRLCRWGPDTGIPASAPMTMETDAAAVLENGVALGVETWNALKQETNWTDDLPHKVICHQVGAWHSDAVLKALSIPKEKDFTTFEYLGNVGTVSLPITAAIAEERGALDPGNTVAFLGIGSGLNCLMLALDW